MTLEQLNRLIVDVSDNMNVVGISFAEHAPWDALNLKNMLEQFPMRR